MEKCKSCGNDATGTCVKCQQQFCNVHGTRTGQGTPVCFPCLQIERYKDRWTTIYFICAIGTLMGLVMPGIIWLNMYDSPYGWIFIGAGIAIGSVLGIKLIQTLMK